MAANLAAIHNLDPQKAASSRLMHDLAKCFKHQLLLYMAREKGLILDPILETNPHPLHANTGAIVARDTLCLQDQQVLDAIANHTLGGPDMIELSCIVFLGDTLELGRSPTTILKALRQISRKNISKAVYLTCDYTLKKFLGSPTLIYPLLIATRNTFLLKCKC